MVQRPRAAGDRAQQMAEQQRYRVIKRLASGGMAEVFVAESAGIEGFKKRVAIKRVLPHLSKKDQFVAMFLDEARLSAQLSHSNVVSVFDIGVGDGAYFIVMEYVDGADLRNVNEHRKKLGKTIPVEAAVFICAKICQGLAYAHEVTTPDGVPLQIVHRDITPANVLMTKHGEVKIVDFGLAKATSQLAKSDPGIIKGKFGYLAPETVLESGVDHRVDIFAVGIMLWELLAGRRLFQGDTDFATVRLVRDAVIPPLSKINGDVPPELDALLGKTLAKDPSQRYSSARELGRDLVRFLYGFGRPVNEDDVASLVRSAMGTPAHHLDPTQKIAELIDLTLLEFKSLAKEESDGEGIDPGAVSLNLSFLGEPQGRARPGETETIELGGLADELEGPESMADNTDASRNTGWFSRWLR
ncbi:serine/threonine protein kinase [Chondromyces apiculatus DSM 436]|uniref:Serine/threonine protein kinase n=2 Tax=Chondromyces apiculatus TaxID=51 RepID=A0A017T2D9_9BACT|nr:serine/threonine protein kinase [Chondromyces apiculatus DSM 436]